MENREEFELFLQNELSTWENIVKFIETIDREGVNKIHEIEQSRSMSFLAYIITRFGIEQFLEAVKILKKRLSRYDIARLIHYRRVEESDHDGEQPLFLKIDIDIGMSEHPIWRCYMKYGMPKTLELIREVYDNEMCYLFIKNEQGMSIHENHTAMEMAMRMAPVRNRWIVSLR